MKKPIVCTIMGTRPELIKLAPLISKLDHKYQHILISTGQHYSDNMYESVRKSLGVRKANINLRFSSILPKPLQLSQTFESLFKRVKKISPSLIIVQGDTFSTLLGALVAKSLSVKLLHIEAGARSFDQRMPEEIIRIVVDHLSSTNQAFNEAGVKYLKAEKLQQPTYLLPNSGIESIHFFRNKIKAASTFQIYTKNSILVTLHRNTNVDDYERLA